MAGHQEGGEKAEPRREQAVEVARALNSLGPRDYAMGRTPRTWLSTANPVLMSQVASHVESTVEEVIDGVACEAAIVEVTTRPVVNAPASADMRVRVRLDDGSVVERSFRCLLHRVVGFRLPLEGVAGVSPGGESRVVDEAVTDGGEVHKGCPRCAEEVKLDAVVCRFCGYRFDRGMSREGMFARWTAGIVALALVVALTIVWATGVLDKPLSLYNASLNARSCYRYQNGVVSCGSEASSQCKALNAPGASVAVPPGQQFPTCFQGWL